jgi:hypothetical protein
MSTKIYDAYEFKGNLTELMSLLNKMRKRVFSLGVAECAREISDPSKFGLIDYSDGLKKAFASCLYEAIDPKLGVLNNVTSSAVVYTYKGRLFVQFFGLPRGFKISNKLVDYHYQNQCDPWYEDDRRAKDKVWRKAQAANYRSRRRVWDAITRMDTRPVHCGLVYEFIAVSDAFEVAHAVFVNLHGHKLYEKSACAICDKRREADREAA